VGNTAKTSRRFILGIGGFSTCAKIVECLLIYYWVDRKMPQDHKDIFCVIAMGFVEGMMAVVAAMSYGATDTVPFDGQGKVFFTSWATLAAAQTYILLKRGSCWKQ
jgi:hypothetical protein